MIEQTVKDYAKELEELGISFTIEEHPEVSDVGECLGFFGLTLDMGASSMLLKAGDDFVLVNRRDDTKLDFGKLKKVLNTQSIRVATKEEFRELTKLQIGAARPYIPGILTLTDKQILEREVIQSGSGSFTSSIRYKTADLHKIPNSQIVDVATTVVTVNTKVFKRILSGITPSGNELHIGNYFGAVKPQIELQNSGSETFYFVADLHALTTIRDRDVLESNIEGVVLDYLALGLDPAKTTFFRQSDVPAHSQLAIVLTNFVTLGHMKRMHAYKDKLQKGFDAESVNMGLFDYPILMAADILLYQPDGVPVGEDQRQHVEITRDIADCFNTSFHKDILKLPEPLISKEVGKVIGTDGQRKMGKSLNNFISIFGDEARIKQQIMGSYTDPNRLKATDPGKVEGNPVFMYHDLVNTNKEEVGNLKERYTKGQVGDVEVKQKLFAAHMEYFKNAREKREQYKSDNQLVKQILKDGARKANETAEKTLKSVYETIGILNKLN